MEFVIPTHQGRPAEYLLMKCLLMKCLVKSGQVAVGNTHFDTTRANIENVGPERAFFLNVYKEFAAANRPEGESFVLRYAHHF